MIGIKQGDPDLLERLKLNLCRALQGNHFENESQMLVMLSSSLQDPSHKVHAMWIFLNSQKQTTSDTRAVDKRRLQRLQTFQMVTMHVGQKAGQWRRLIRVFTKVIYSYARKFANDAIEGRHFAGGTCSSLGFDLNPLCLDVSFAARSCGLLDRRELECDRLAVRIARRHKWTSVKHVLPELLLLPARAKLL